MAAASFFISIPPCLVGVPHHQQLAASPFYVATPAATNDAYSFLSTPKRYELKPQRSISNKVQLTDFDTLPGGPIKAENQVRFGILGCANVAQKVCRAIRLAPNTTIQAVGSRSIEKATRFAAENDFPSTAKIYGSYEAVLDDADVDVVYVPLPTSLHLKWAVLAAQKKKHLLLEKPVAVDVAELDMILAACESNGVQYMDGTMWMHHPRTAQMKDFLSDGQRFGQLKTMHSMFTINPGEEFLKTDIRVNPALDSLGALGDTGWYCIRAILWANDYKLPNTVTAMPKPEFSPLGAIMSCGATLNWDDGNLATFYCSFFGNITMDITCVGTEGYLRLHDFVIPYQEKLASFHVASNSEFADLLLGSGPVPTERIAKTELPQEALMVQEFGRLVTCIKEDGFAPEKKWGIISRNTQVVVDAVKASIEKGLQAVEIG